MKNLLAGIVIGLISVSAAAIEPHYPRHSSPCSTDHEAETWQGTSEPDSCITGTPGDPDITCDHTWGPSVWASIDTNGNSCATGIACVSIWCGTSGGWTLKQTHMSVCPGRLQADDSGIYCFLDNNSDGRYTSGDTLLDYEGC